MQKNNDFSYSKDGVTIVFNELPLLPHAKEPYYEFEVLDNPELTEKLRKSVKNKRVKNSSIYYCARALFEIISIGEFEEVVSDERRKKALSDFIEKTGKEPLFVTKKISTNPPRSNVRLVNHNLKGAIIENEARNTITAQTLCIERFLELEK